MKKSNKLKMAVLSMAMGLGLAGTVSASSSSCQQWCVGYSWTMQQNFCARIGGDSACATSQPLNAHMYNECVSLYC